MDTLTRRKFLITSGVVGAAGLAAGGAAYALSDILGGPQATGRPTARRWSWSPCTAATTA